MRRISMGSSLPTFCQQWEKRQRNAYEKSFVDGSWDLEIAIMDMRLYNYFIPVYIVKEESRVILLDLSYAIFNYVINDELLWMRGLSDLDKIDQDISKSNKIDV